MSDHANELNKFARKSYRDGYLQTQVRGSIAYQIQALRAKMGLTQTGFAERVGKRQTAICRLENTEYGRVTVQTLLDIASALDVALLVRFVSYPEFLLRSKDMTVPALQPDTIYESIARRSQIRDAMVPQKDANRIQRFEPDELFPRAPVRPRSDASDLANQLRDTAN